MLVSFDGGTSSYTITDMLTALEDGYCLKFLRSERCEHFLSNMEMYFGFRKVKKVAKVGRSSATVSTMDGVNEEGLRKVF